MCIHIYSLTKLLNLLICPKICKNNEYECKKSESYANLNEKNLIEIVPLQKCIISKKLMCRAFFYLMNLMDFNIIVL